MTREELAVLEALESSGRPWTPEGNIRPRHGGTRPIPGHLGALGNAISAIRGTPLEWLMPFQGTLEAWGNNQQPSYLANLLSALDVPVSVPAAAAGSVFGKMASKGVDDLVEALGPLGRQLGSVPGLRKEGGRSVFDVGGKTYNTVPVGEVDISMYPKASAKATREGRVLPAIHGDESSGQALERPWKEMRRDVRRQNRVELEAERPAELRVGDDLISTQGDRSDINLSLRGVDSHKFDKSVPVTGGFGNMRRADGRIWAAGPARVGRLHNQALPAINEGRRALLWSMPQGSTSLDFSNALSNSMLHAARGSVSPENAAVFDRMMWEINPDWVGLHSPNAQRWLYGKFGARRQDFMGRAGTKAARNLGFPLREELAFGLTDPKLLTVPDAYGGQNIAEYSGRNFSDPGGTHAVFPQVMEGRYAGGLAHPIPYQVAFPDWFANRVAETSNRGGDKRSLEFLIPRQTVNQGLLDQIGLIQQLGEEEGLRLGRLLSF